MAVTTVEIRLVSSGIVRSLLDPKQLLSESIRLGIPTAHWAGKPNSVILFRGRKAGVAHLLLLKSQLDLLDQTATNHQIGIFGGTNEIILNNWTIVRSEAILGGEIPNPQTAYLVQLEDIRTHGQFTEINSTYNIRALDGGFFANSLNSGSEWTWATLLANMWGNLPPIFGVAPTAPSTLPTANPENLRFQGVNCWDSINDLIEKYGHSLALDNDGGFVIVDLATSIPSTLASIVESRTSSAQDMEFLVIPEKSKMPEEIKVFFPSENFAFQDSTDQEENNGNDYQKSNPFAIVSIATSTINNTVTTQSGTTKAIHDNRVATFDTNGNALNTSELTTRANEIATQFIGAQLLRDESNDGVFSGLHDLPLGADIAEIAFYDTGGGLFTQIASAVSPSIGKPFSSRELGAETQPIPNLLAEINQTADLQRQHERPERVAIATLSGDLSALGSVSANMQFGTISGSSIVWADTGLPHTETVFEGLSQTFSSGDKVFCIWHSQVKEWIAISGPVGSWTAQAESGSDRIVNGVPVRWASGNGIGTTVITIGPPITITYSVDNTVAQQVILTQKTGGTVAGSPVTILVSAGIDNSIGINAGNNMTFVDEGDGTFTVSSSGGLESFIIKDSSSGTDTIDATDNTITYKTNTPSALTVSVETDTATNANVVIDAVDPVFSVASSPASFDVNHGGTVTFTDTTSINFTVAAGPIVTANVKGTVLTVTDGSTPQAIEYGDTLTFADTTSINFTTSATDTVSAVIQGQLFTITDVANTESISFGNQITFIGGNGMTALVSSTDNVTYSIDGTVLQNIALSGAGASGTTPVLVSAGTANSIELIAGSNITLVGGAGTITIASSGTTGITDNRLVRGDGGTTIQDSGITVDDSDNMTGISGITATGVIDFGGATSFEIPNNATPTVNADGEMAWDSTVTDWSTGIIRFFGTEEQGIVTMPIAQFSSPTGEYVVTYDATADEFQLKEAAGGGSFTSFDVAADSGTTPLTITDGNTLSILAEDGMTTVASATDTITIKPAGVYAKASANSGDATSVAGNFVPNYTGGASGAAVTIRILSGGHGTNIRSGDVVEVRKGTDGEWTTSAGSDDKIGTVKMFNGDIADGAVRGWVRFGDFDNSIQASRRFPRGTNTTNTTKVQIDAANGGNATHSHTSVTGATAPGIISEIADHDKHKHVISETLRDINTLGTNDSQAGSVTPCSGSEVADPACGAPGVGIRGHKAKTTEPTHTHSISSDSHEPLYQEIFFIKRTS